jgi:DNA-binding LacI/PurR family transcriptional regulator
MAGVSIATASRALNDSPAVNDRTKQAIWKLAREHDYPFRRYMPAGPIGAQGTIALVTPRPQGREGHASAIPSSWNCWPASARPRGSAVAIWS